MKLVKPAAGFAPATCSRMRMAITASTKKMARRMSCTTRATRPRAPRRERSRRSHAGPRSARTRAPQDVRDGRLQGRPAEDETLQAFDAEPGLADCRRGVTRAVAAAGDPRPEGGVS